MSKSKQWDSFRWLRDGNNSITVRPLAKGPLVEPIRVTRIDLEFNTETGILTTESRFTTESRGLRHERPSWRAHAPMGQDVQAPRGHDQRELAMGFAHARPPSSAALTVCALAGPAAARAGRAGNARNGTVRLGRCGADGTHGGDEEGATGTVR